MSQITLPLDIKSLEVVSQRIDIAFCVPIASIVTIWSFKSSKSNNFGIAVISFDFSSTFCCAKMRLKRTRNILIHFQLIHSIIFNNKWIKQLGTFCQSIDSRPYNTKHPHPIIVVGEGSQSCQPINIKSN